MGTPIYVTLQPTQAYIYKILQIHFPLSFKVSQVIKKNNNIILLKVIVLGLQTIDTNLLVWGDLFW